MLNTELEAPFSQLFKLPVLLSRLLTINITVPYTHLQIRHSLSEAEPSSGASS